MKGFVSAKDDEKKVIFKQLEEEAAKLKGSSARFSQTLILICSVVQ